MPIIVYVLSLHYVYDSKAFSNGSDRIRISYPKGPLRIGFSFVTLIIQIDAPKSEQIRNIARPIPSDANTHI